MRKTICLIVFSSLLLFVANAQPIIINDTGAWHGGIIATRNFNLETDNNFWLQNGSNSNTRIIRTAFNIYEDGYSPVITNIGINKVFAIYQLYDGTIVKDSTEFETSKLVIQDIEVIKEEPESLRREYMIDGLPASSFPDDGIVYGEYNYTISHNSYLVVASNSLTNYSKVFSYASLVSGFAALLPSLQPEAGTISLGTALISAIFDILSTSINFVNNETVSHQITVYIPESGRPYGGQKFYMVGYYLRQNCRKRCYVYDDFDDWNGYVPNRKKIEKEVSYHEDLGFHYDYCTK